MQSHSRRHASLSAYASSLRSTTSLLKDWNPWERGDRVALQKNQSCQSEISSCTSHSLRKPGDLYEELLACEEAARARKKKLSWHQDVVDAEGVHQSTCKHAQSADNFSNALNKSGNPPSRQSKRERQCDCFFCRESCPLCKKFQKEKKQLRYVPPVPSQDCEHKELFTDLQGSTTTSSTNDETGSKNYRLDAELEESRSSRSLQQSKDRARVQIVGASSGFKRCQPKKEASRDSQGSFSSGSSFGSVARKVLPWVEACSRSRGTGADTSSVLLAAAGVELQTDEKAPNDVSLSLDSSSSFIAEAGRNQRPTKSSGLEAAHGKSSSLTSSEDFLALIETYQDSTPSRDTGAPLSDLYDAVHSIDLSKSPTISPTSSSSFTSSDFQVTPRTSEDVTDTEATQEGEGEVEDLVKLFEDMEDVDKFRDYENNENKKKVQEFAATGFLPKEGIVIGGMSTFADVHEAEFLVVLSDDILDTFLQKPSPFLVAAFRTSCEIEATRRIVNRCIGGYRWLKYLVVVIRGPSCSAIECCDRLMSIISPPYARRRQYSHRSPVSVFVKEDLPDNAELCFAYQRTGKPGKKFGELFLKSPYCDQVSVDAPWRTSGGMAGCVFSDIQKSLRGQEHVYRTWGTEKVPTVSHAVSGAQGVEQSLQLKMDAEMDRVRKEQLKKDNTLPLKVGR